MRPQISIEELIERFQFFDDWTERYRYLIDLGRGLPSLDPAHRVDANIVKGCQSQVWLIHRPGDNSSDTLHFEADSDAHIVRGLIAILLTAFSGRTLAEIEAVDHDSLFETLGLTHHLSPSRTNGLFSMVSKIRALARVSTKSN